MRIAIGADHAGFALKELLREELEGLADEVADFGTDSEASCDYPDIAIPLARAVGSRRSRPRRADLLQRRRALDGGQQDRGRARRVVPRRLLRPPRARAHRRQRALPRRLVDRPRPRLGGAAARSATPNSRAAATSAGSTRSTRWTAPTEPDCALEAGSLLWRRRSPGAVSDPARATGAAESRRSSDRRAGAGAGHRERPSRAPAARGSHPRAWRRGPRRDSARPVRGAAHLRGPRAGRAVRPGLRPRAGPPVPDRRDAPPRLRPRRRAGRPSRAAVGPLHAPPRPRRPRRRRPGARRR